MIDWLAHSVPIHTGFEASHRRDLEHGSMHMFYAAECLLIDRRGPVERHRASRSLIVDVLFVKDCG